MDVERFMAEGLEDLSDEGEGEEEGKGQPAAVKRKRDRKER